MSRKTSLFVATAAVLAAFAAAPSASLAAAKKSEASQRSDFTDPTKCLGVSCTVSNPDRMVNYSVAYLKKPKRKARSASAGDK